MKAVMEMAPLQHPGVVMESLTPEEAQRLKDIWCGHGVIVEFNRLPDGSVSLVIAPSAEEDTKPVSV